MRWPRRRGKGFRKIHLNCNLYFVSYLRIDIVVCDCYLRVFFKNLFSRPFLQHSYGFIQCCDRQARLFFHFSQFDGNIEHLKIGDPVEFEMTYDRRTGKPIASMVSKIAPEVVSSGRPVTPGVNFSPWGWTLASLFFVSPKSKFRYLLVMDKNELTIEGKNVSRGS
jgi:cold shock CspA family protein